VIRPLLHIFPSDGRWHRGTQVQYFFGSLVPTLLTPELYWVGINTAAPRFIGIACTLRKESARDVFRQPRRGGLHMSTFQGPLFGLVVGFTFLCRTTWSALKFLFYFNCNTLDQKVKARSLGSFTGAPPTPHAGWMCFNSQFPPPSNITTIFFSGMTRSRSSFADPHCFF